MVLQRGLFRGLVHTAITPKTEVHPQARELEGPYVMVANHATHLDAPLMMQSVPRKQGKYLATGVAYDYFFTTWYKRWFVRWFFNAFPVDRDGSRRHSGITQRLLEADVPVLVFPEGTRQQSGQLSTFSAGPMKMAMRSETPILPAALVGAHVAMPKGRSWPIPGRPTVGVMIGAPMWPHESETLEEFSNRVHTEVKNLQDQGNTLFFNGSLK